MSATPDDLGPVVSHLALRDGTPVYDPDGRQVGVAEDVVTPGDAAIFDGLVIHTRPLPGRHVCADHDQIAELHERGVLLAVPVDALHPLPEQRRRPGRDDPAERSLEARLRRAWDRLTGARI